MQSAAEAKTETQPGPTEIEPIEITYNKVVDGVRTDERLPLEESVTAEQAAKHLAEFRNQYDNAREYNARQSTASLIDAVQAQRAVEQTPVEQPAAQEPSRSEVNAAAAMAEQAKPTSPLPDGVDPEVARVLQENPKVREALQAEVQQIQAAGQAYASALQSNAQAAMASLLSAYPKLQNIQTNDQFHGALAVLAQQNPQRASEIVAHIQKTNAVVAHWQQAAQAQHEQAARQWQNDWAKFAAAEDAKFDKAMPELAADKEAARKLADAAMTTLRSVGFSDQDLHRAYHGEVALSLRDHRAQLILAKAAMFDAAKAAVPPKQVRSVPRVQRPGNGERHDDYSGSQISELSQRLNRTGNVKDAARLLAARRAR